MKISDKLQAKAFKHLIKGEGGHWHSALTMDAGKYRLYDEGRRVSQLIVLWWVFLGKPISVLSNACGDTTCVNPYHYKDGSDREDAEWARMNQANLGSIIYSHISGSWVAPISLSALDAPWEDEARERAEDDVMSLIDLFAHSAHCIHDVYGLTHDFGCYHCGTRFDPFESRNKVLCNDCWSEEDQREMEKRDAA